MGKAQGLRLAEVEVGQDYRWNWRGGTRCRVAEIDARRGKVRIRYLSAGDILTAEVFPGSLQPLEGAGQYAIHEGQRRALGQRGGPAEKRLARA